MIEALLQSGPKNVRTHELSLGLKGFATVFGALTFEGKQLHIPRLGKRPVLIVGRVIAATETAEFSKKAPLNRGRSLPTIKAE
jgi:hypothetical protein